MCTSAVSATAPGDRDVTKNKIPSLLPRQRSRRDPCCLQCDITEVAFGIKWIIYVLSDHPG